MSTRRTTGRVVVTAVTLVVVAFAGFPLYWMLDTALSNDAELYRTGQGWLPHLGRLVDLPDMLGDVAIFTWLGNSAFIAFGTTFLSLCMATLGAYALSRYRFHGKGFAGFLLFTTQMLPEALLVVPFYALFAGLGLLNNLGGLVLADTAFTMPVSVWILKGAMDAIPYEIEESARVDGCPTFGRLSMIVFPLVLPSLAAAAVINFFDGWNEFLFASTFIADPHKWPASVGLASFVGQYSTPLNSVMSAALVFTLPAVIFFLIVQRQIVSGLTAGSVKG